ncbi:hypothetical protein NHQ30_007285 [Ciborinia camelliae]|nr:hypothetical protein NHQ30_007285 [Ciborinia camelliae]
MYLPHRRPSDYLRSVYPTADSLLMHEADSESVYLLYEARILSPAYHHYIPLRNESHRASYSHVDQASTLRPFDYEKKNTSASEEGMNMVCASWR